MNDEELKYPMGRFKANDFYTEEERLQFIETIEMLPVKVELMASSFTPTLLDTPYREGGWTVRQVIHHMADSHLNAYIRLKWTLTEASPTIKAYDEKLWALTPETSLDPSISMDLLKTLHKKWGAILRLLSEENLKKNYIHPETGKAVSLFQQLALYAWHCEHHLAHIRLVVK